MHSLVLLAVVCLATGPVSGIPLAALAGVLMVTSFRMVSPHTARSILRSTRADAAIFAVTAVITICFDLIEAVQIGIVVAAFFALRQWPAAPASPRTATRPGPPGDEHIALLLLDGAMFFGAAERISTAITGGADDHPDVRVVIIRMSRLGMIDATGAHTLAEIVTELEGRGVTVILKGVQDEHHQLLSGVGVFDSPVMRST